MRATIRSASAVGLATMLWAVLVLPVSAARSPSMVMTVCAPNGGPDLLVTVTWSDLQANAWSIAALYDPQIGVWDYGDGYQRLPKQQSSGTVSHLFTGVTTYYGTFDGNTAGLVVSYLYKGSAAHPQAVPEYPGGRDAIGPGPNGWGGWPACV